MPKTWGGRSSFEYSGSVEKGTEITYGKGWIVRVSAHEYTDLRNHFCCRIVPVGTSRTDPPGDSLGAWLIRNVTRTGIVSYVAAILIIEGYAKRVGKHDICIIK